MCVIIHSNVWIWRIHVCAMTYSYVQYDSSIRVTRLISMRAMSHSYVWHSPFIYMTWRIHMYAMPHSYVRFDIPICVMWLFHKRTCLILVFATTYLYVWYDVLICVMSHIQMSTMSYLHVWYAYECAHDICDMTQSYEWYSCAYSYMWNLAFICLPCLIHTCEVWMRKQYVWYDASYVWHSCVYSYIWSLAFSCVRASSIRVKYGGAHSMCDMTHSYV